MYRVTGDGITIYDDIHSSESFKATNPKLVLKDNSAGSFEITLPPGNAGYDKLEKLSSEIIVYRDGIEIWSGRIINENKDFWNNRKLTCEGELAYLNDSLQPPAKFEDKTVRQYLVSIIDNHNSQVETRKRFTIGAVTVEETINQFTNDENTYAVIADTLVNRLGGHLRVRKEGTTRYLDYIKDWPSTNSQEIRFGQNLLDFTRNWDATSLITVVKPRGARLDEGPIEELEAFLDVTEVNGGSPYVTNEEGIKKYGWIAVTVNWDDVEDVEELLTKAKEYLADIQFDNMVVQLSAVDLRYLNTTFDSIRLLDQIRCVSPPHGMDRIFNVSELSIQLDKPDASTYTLGDIIQNSLTSSAAQSQAIADRLEYQQTPQEILQSAKDNATQIINSATRGYVTIVKATDGTESLAISSDLSYNPNTNLWSDQTRLWRWNINGLGYSEDGGRNYGLAIRMDGKIVADYITTGTLTAVRIESLNGDSSWDLTTGIFTMKRGSISLGKSETYPDGRFTVNDSGYLRAEYGVIGGFIIGEDPIYRRESIYNNVLNLSDSGLSFKRNNIDIGSFRTNNIRDNDSQRGIVMDLEYTGNYISWASMDSSSANVYSMKLTYVGKSRSASGFISDRISMGCNLDGKNWFAHNLALDIKTGGPAYLTVESGTQVANYVGTTYNGVIYLPTSPPTGPYLVTYVRNGFIVNSYV